MLDNLKLNILLWLHVREIHLQEISKVHNAIGDVHIKMHSFQEAMIHFYQAYLNCLNLFGDNDERTRFIKSKYEVARALNRHVLATSTA